MKRAIAILTLACLVAGTITADAKRRRHRDHDSHPIRNTVLVLWVLAEDDCPSWHEGRKLSQVTRDGERLACIYEVSQ